MCRKVRRHCVLFILFLIAFRHHHNTVLNRIGNWNVYYTMHNKWLWSGEAKEFSWLSVRSSYIHRMKTWFVSQGKSCHFLFEKKKKKYLRKKKKKSVTVIHPFRPQSCTVVYLLVWKRNRELSVFGSLPFTVFGEGKVREKGRRGVSWGKIEPENH